MYRWIWINRKKTRENQKVGKRIFWWFEIDLPIAISIRLLRIHSLRIVSLNTFFYSFVSSKSCVSLERSNFEKYYGPNWNQMTFLPVFSSGNHQNFFHHLFWTNISNKLKHQKKRTFIPPLVGCFRFVEYWCRKSSSSGESFHSTIQNGLPAKHKWPEMNCRAYRRASICKTKQFKIAFKLL